MAPFGAFDISSSALTANKVRMDTISQNLANSNTTRTSKGEPFRRQIVVLEEAKGNSFSQKLSDSINGLNVGKGVRVTKIVEDSSPFRIVYEPGHPDADANGYVKYPNIDTIIEMVNMMSATRAYEANVTCLNASKSMLMKDLEIGKGG